MADSEASSSRKKKKGTGKQSSQSNSEEEVAGRSPKETSNKSLGGSPKETSSAILNRKSLRFSIVDFLAEKGRKDKIMDLKKSA